MATPKEIRVDEDLAMMEPTMNTKCPITLQEMINPVNNKHCNHIYDLEGARSLIKNRGEKARFEIKFDMTSYFLRNYVTGDFQLADTDF